MYKQTKPRTHATCFQPPHGFWFSGSSQACRYGFRLRFRCLAIRLNLQCAYTADVHHAHNAATLGTRSAAEHQLLLVHKRSTVQESWSRTGQELRLAAFNFGFIRARSGALDETPQILLRLSCLSWRTVRLKEARG